MGVLDQEYLLANEPAYQEHQREQHAAPQPQPGRRLLVFFCQTGHANEPGAA